MKKLIGRAAAFLCAAVMMTAQVGAAIDQNPVRTPVEPEKLDINTYLPGVWSGYLPAYKDEDSFYSDAVVLDINLNRSKPILMQIHTIDPDTYVEPNAWSISKDVLTFSQYNTDWYAVAALWVSDANTLTGTYTQKGRELEMTLTRVSSVPAGEGELQTDFIFEGRTASQWLAELREYPSFASGDAGEIPYTYEINQGFKSFSMLYQYGVMSVVDGRSDIAIMQSLLDLVDDNFTYNGAVALGENIDPLSVIAQHNLYGGIECRGLAIILSEMLRACGIEAKPVMCLPAVEPSECHVVVHAYSQSQGQWIMLDPSCRLMLRNGSGQYLSLPMFRNALITGEKLYASDNAGTNGGPFYMDRYRAYMSKNMFRFCNATDFYFGGESFPDTDERDERDQGNAYHLGGVRFSGPPSIGGETGGEQSGDSAQSTGNGAEKAAENPQHMLVPVEYDVPFPLSRREKVTTNATAFWAAPTSNTRTGAETE